MIDFTLSDTDREVLAEVRREGMISRKFARYYDEHEDELYPDAFPEAEQFRNLGALMRQRGKTDTPLATFTMLTAMEQSRCDGPPLRTRPGGLGNAALRATGTSEQRKKWSHLTIAMAITEPGCGSDSKAIQTTASLDGDQWVLNGEKIFVTRGVRCDAVVVWATLDPSAGRAGIKSFFVPKDTPGFEVARKEKKLGIRMSDTAAFVLSECRIPRENLLGGDESIPKEGSGGFKGVMKTFNMTRPGVGAGGVGKAQACLDFTLEELGYTDVPRRYERALHARTAVEQKLIEIEADIEAARLTVLRAAALVDEALSNNVEASIAKAKGGEVARTCTQRCLKILGGLGISREYLPEKWFRDGRISDIYEGTGQIQRLIIARAILGYSSDDLS